MQAKDIEIADKLRSRILEKLEALEKTPEPLGSYYHDRLEGRLEHYRSFLNAAKIREEIRSISIGNNSVKS